MNSKDRPEFDKQLAILCAGLDTPCTDERKEAYWKSLQSMSLLVFARTIEHMLAEESWVRIPKPSQVWEASKRLRALAPEKPKDDGFRGDMWDEAANRHLLAYLLQALREKPKRYGQCASAGVMRLPQSALDTLGLDRRELDASGEFIACVERLVAYKNAWAQDMRDWGSLPTAEEQKRTWRQCMERAESDLRKAA